MNPRTLFEFQRVVFISSSSVAPAFRLINSRMVAFLLPSLAPLASRLAAFGGGAFLADRLFFGATCGVCGARVAFGLASRVLLSAPVSVVASTSVIFKYPLVMVIAIRDIDRSEWRRRQGNACGFLIFLPLRLLRFRAIHLTMITIGYARVSTDRQADKGVSLDAQKSRIEAMAVVQDPGRCSK